MTRDEMTSLTRDARSLSEKIRQLHDAGVPKAEIASFLDRRYQHVYNVIKDYERRRGDGARVVADEAPSVSSVFSLSLQRDGVVSLPADWLKAQGLREGDPIICRPEAGGLLLLSRAAATEMLREMARKRMPEEAALFDALLGSKMEK